MITFPFGYEPIAQTTWVYLSSLLMLSLFFKFNRMLSMRNIDLFLIILLAPGLLMIYFGSQWRHEAFLRTSTTNVEQQQLADVTDPVINGPAAAPPRDVLTEELTAEQREAIRQERRGYIWLFGVGLIWLVRLLLDPLLHRRPMLDPNLTIGGLAFLGCSFMVFLFANVITSQPVADDLYGPRSAEALIRGEAVLSEEDLRRRGPGFVLFHFLPIMPTFVNHRTAAPEDPDQPTQDAPYRFRDEVAAKTVAIIGQIAIVLGLVFIGRWHFGNFATGVGMATIYLMLPYTAQMTGRVMHILPAALLVWAMALYRKPTQAGAFVGLAAGVAYYPLFLLPLWISFYWQRGAWRFVAGLAISLAIIVGSLVFTSRDVGQFALQLRGIFGFWVPLVEGLEGIWALGWDPWFRLPLLVGFVAMCVTFAFWPAQKNLGTLMALTAAVMVGVQFWHGFGGGLHMAWYLPFGLMTFFRPNLEDRIAEETVKSPRWPFRRLRR